MKNAINQRKNIVAEMKGDFCVEHYFTNQPTSISKERIIEYVINGKNLSFISDNGVFSKQHIDIATNFMLTVLMKEKIEGTLLDVGCGYGVIGITLAKCFSVDVTMLDINERALELAKKNCMRNGETTVKIVNSNGFENIEDQFNVIVTNPPIRAGKSVIYQIYKDSYEHLVKGGAFYLVINKKHGAPSTKDFLTQLFGNCEVLDHKAGFQVMKCVK